MAQPPIISRLQDMAERAYSSLTGVPSTFAPSAHTHPASEISDSTADGRAFLTAASVAAQRTLLGLGSLALVTPTGTPDGTKFLRDDYSWQTIDLSSYATTAAVAAGYQPLDSDLTAIAALTTTSFGRGLLASATGALAAVNSVTSATGTALTLATLDTNKDINLTPHGTGTVWVGTQTSPGILGFGHSSGVHQYKWFMATTAEMMVKDYQNTNLGGFYTNNAGKGGLYTIQVLPMTTDMYLLSDNVGSIGKPAQRWASMYALLFSFGTNKGSIGLSTDATSGHMVFTPPSTGKFMFGTGTIDSNWMVTVGNGTGRVHLQYGTGSDSYVGLSRNATTDYAQVNYYTGATRDYFMGVQATTSYWAVGSGSEVIRVSKLDRLSFFAATPAAQQTVTGSRGGNAALASLITALATFGLVVDSTSA